MTGKKGGLPDIIAAKLPESRFFTMGAIFFKNRQCDEFLSHCSICIVRSCLATKFGSIAAQGMMIQ